MHYHHGLLLREKPGSVTFGGVRMAFLDIESGLWGLRRQIEALAGARLADSVLQQAGTNGGAAFARSLGGQFNVIDPVAAFQDCVAAFQAAGWGTMEIEVLEWPLGRVVVRVKGSPEAWMYRRHQPYSEHAVCSFAAGVLVGFANVLAQRRDIVCVERQCEAQGANSCGFELLLASQAGGAAATVTFNPDPFLSRQISLLDLLMGPTPMGVAVLDEHLTLRRFNPTWAAFLARATRTPADQFLPGASLREVVPGVEDCHGSLFKRALHGETVRVEAVPLHSDGLVSYWDMALTPLIEGGRVTGLVQVLTDATQRAGAYRELERRVEERNREIARRRTVAEGLREILTALNSGKPLDKILNQIVWQARQMLGADTVAVYRLEGDLLGVEASNGLSAGFAAGMKVPLGRGAVGRAVAQRRPVVVDAASDLALEHDEMVDERRSYLTWLIGRYKTILAVPLIIKDEIYGGISLYYRECRDFPADDVALAVAFADQAALAIENARLRERAREAAAAAERTRLARDLHDAVTQTLFSASLIAEVLPRLWERNPAEGPKRLGELRQLTRGALAEMRTLLLELRPAALTESGFGELLGQLAEAVTGRGRIPVTLDAEGSCPLPADVQIALYRIAQEALNNVVRHSGAKSAKVTLRCREDGLDLTIRDDGRGFDPATARRDHLGLGNMRERAESVGAVYRLTSAPGEGTEVSVTWNAAQEVQGP